MILKRQGYYKEMPHGDANDPSIMDVLNKNNADKNAICRYLQSGYVLAACGSVVKDVVCPDEGVIGAPDEITDGVWIWPADLAYYVEKYNIKLDEAFIRHMSENSWRIPADLEIDEDDIEVI